MAALTRKFPGHADAIRQLRNRDETFAEICHDFEILMGLLPCAADDPILPCVRDSLLGLEQEIRSYLGMPATGPVTTSPRQSGQLQGSDT